MGDVGSDMTCYPCLVTGDELGSMPEVESVCQLVLRVVEEGGGEVGVEGGRKDTGNHPRVPGLDPSPPEQARSVA